MLGLIITLLVIWLILTILGLVIKGLAWLAAIGIILFVVTLAWVGIRRLLASRRDS
ncbi:hypothetical protein [Paramicrobacterium agarici]|uniref:LPXTG-motif cell wall-anchored protein n=1 Tax=Paramicrobacterium agarici TaxID=630514 RepID=A0A2A9DVU3_9MICO|nr:hypothetical protein [Microbacterium agarici]PFG30461.1 hypothetical protein ATJ78_1390 [Microbacterium agarici]TQO23474.1 hypothetical protein FB385_2324 [Microbacterium agarici]